ncbi:MAG: hypothetical protein ACE5QV_04585, partial [Fidelibacterota bacterium]
TVYVKSILPADAETIRDIKGPMPVPPYLRWWIFLILAGILFLLLLSFFYFKRRGVMEDILKIKTRKTIRPAHVVALEKLARLENWDFSNPDRLKEYFFQVSYIVREYIENRFFIYALEMTNREIFAELEDEKIDDDAIRIIKDILTLCDLVKFAKYTPSADEIHQTYTRSISLVEKTKFTLSRERESYSEVEN